MEQDFYRKRLERSHGIDVMIPELNDRQTVHDVIYNELCLGNVKESSKKRYLDVIDCLSGAGAEAVILGCTEIGLLISQTDTATRLFDTTAIHAQAAVDEALSD